MKKLIRIAIITSAAIVLLYHQQPSHPQWMEEDESMEVERESGADKQLASWWWTKGYPDPTFINEKYEEAWVYAEAMKHPEIISQANVANITSSTAIFNGNWTPIGPNQNIGGRVLCVAVDPSNGNNILIGTASGGMWKTKTGGTGTAAWQPVVTGLPLLGVASIIINPDKPNIIYAGTGEVYRSDTSNIGFNVWKARGTYGVGIIKSTDGGNSWRQVFNKRLSNLFGIQMLEFDPGNPDIIYACTTDGLYRSTDAGLNWSNILAKTYVSDIAIHPINSNRLVVAVGNLTNADKGIYLSTDKGASWTKITAGLPTTFEGFIRLDNVSTNPDLVVASFGRDAGSQNELFRSADFGKNWSVLSNSNHCQYQFWFAHDVAINPSNTRQVMMAGVPLFKYNLSTAASTSIGGVHADIHDIEYDPSNSNIVYVACDGGMYKSTNSGTSFTKINGGLQAVQFYASFAISPTNPNIMIGGLQDNGVVRYDGTGWTSVAGGDGGACVFHPSNSSIVFASNDARRLLRSTNGGASFTEVLSSWAFKADSRTGFMAPVAISKSNPNSLYVASDNLHRSSNNGIAGSWNGDAYTTATSYMEGMHKTGVALAVSPLNASKLYTSTSPFAQYDNDANNLYINAPANLLKSINGGTSFTNIKGTLPDRFVMDFAISPTNDDSVWIVLGGYGTSHVYVTANGGGTWTSKGVGLPDVPTNAVLIDPKNPNIIYVGNDLGVYVSVDKGTTWYDYNNGLWDATLVMDLVATGNGKLVAATHGKGAFISDLYIIRLPVTLVSFTGVNKGNYNHLQWVTNNEVNVSHFELERNIDGAGFNRIATITATNLSTGSGYAYKDAVGVFSYADNVFYRLKIVDLNGQFTYSNVVNIRMPGKSSLIVHNNPFIDKLRMTFGTREPQNINIDVFDASGRWLMRKIITVRSGVNDIEMNNLQHFPAGTYLLTVQTKTERFTKRVVREGTFTRTTR